MNQQRPKYIAEGFVEDSGELISDFLKFSSVEFRDFASVWREHHFSLIFMGRPDYTETNEFVNEIFRISTQYLLEDTLHQKVGGVFLLYALFRTQITKPPIKIRLEMKHFDVVKSLRNEAIEKKYKSLHYVIDYLIDHAFLYVANQTLRGPLIAGLPSEHNVSINKMKQEYKDSFKEYTDCNNLTTLRDLHQEYLDAKKKISSSVLFTTNHEIFQGAVKELDEFIQIEREKEKNVTAVNKKKEMKAEAFEKKSKNKFEVIENKLKDAVPGCSSRALPKVMKKDTQQPTRPRKEDRRPGRPSKKKKEPTPPPEPESDDNDIDISHLLEQQKDLYLPSMSGQSRKCRTKRDPYYQVSPKRRESSESETSE